MANLDDLMRQADERLSATASKKHADEETKKNKMRDAAVNALQLQVEKELPIETREALSVTYGYDRDHAVAHLQAKGTTFELSKPNVATVWDIQWPGHSMQLDTKLGPLNDLLLARIRVVVK
jgi:hypothetical protein